MVLPAVLGSSTVSLTCDQAPTQDIHSARRGPSVPVVPVGYTLDELVTLNTTGYQLCSEFSPTERAARGTRGHLGLGGRDQRGFVAGTMVLELGQWSGVQVRMKGTEARITLCRSAATAPVRPDRRFRDRRSQLEGRTPRDIRRSALHSPLAGRAVKRRPNG